MSPEQTTFAVLDGATALSGVIPTMSSLQIAEITGKEHSNVMRDIRETLEQAEISPLKFEGCYKGGNGKDLPCYHLPRRECDLVVSGYSVKYRLAIIDRWHALESKQSFQIPETMGQALRLAAELSDKVVEQQTALAIAAPKVEFYDAVTESNTDCSMATAAQLAKLPYGQNTLFQKLRERGVLISGGSRNNQPKQRYIEQGLFTVSEGSYTKEKETVVTFTTRVTQKGLSWIIANLSRKQS